MQFPLKWPRKTDPGTTASLQVVEPLPRKTVIYIDHTAALGGGELALLDIVLHLDTRKYKPIILLLSDGPLADRFRAHSIETYILPLDPELIAVRKETLGARGIYSVKCLRSALRSVAQLANFLRSQNADVVHTNSLKADILGGIAARIAHIPVLFHVRDRIEKDYLPALSVRLFRSACRIIPNAVIGNSHATLTSLQLPTRIKTAVVYSGVVLDKMPMSANCTHTNTPPRIGIIGRISPWKGQHIFLHAAAKVRTQFPACKFQIIGATLFGEADYENELRGLAKELHIDDCVEFTGFRNDIPAVLAQLDVLVHASVTGEPFGQTIVQGMAAGKAVVATNGGGVPEIVLHGETGLLVPMGDNDAMASAICDILCNPEKAKAMGRAARKRVEERFTIEHTIRNLESMYRSILG